MRSCMFLLPALALLLSGCTTGQVAAPLPKPTELPLEEALAMELSQSELQQVFSRQFTTRNAEGRLHAALDIMPLCVDSLSSDASYATLGAFMTQLLQTGRYDDLQRTIDYVRTMFPTRIGLQELCTIAEIDCLLISRRFDKAADLLMTESHELSDANLAAVTGRLLAGAEAKIDHSIAEQVCDFVMTKVHGKQRVLDTVAQKWVSLALQQGKPELVPDRLSHLLKAGAAGTVIARAYVDAASDLLRQSDRKLLQQMMQIGQSLAPGINDRNTVMNITRAMLDFSCIVEDYDASVNLLRVCYPDQPDGEEYQRMLNKVLAHKALQDGRKEEAVLRFRTFMEAVKTWDTEQYDPSTGEMVPVNAILGLNARRIGDILVTTGDKKGAATAYAEAKTYYQAAIGEVKSQTVWKAGIEKALQDLNSNLKQTNEQ